MSSTKAKPNLLDVARHAGVSPATVSRVVNNSAPVRASVRERVLTSLNALGYEPPSTRPHALLAHNIIAVVVPDILNPFFTEVVRGVEDEAGSGEYMLLLLDTVEDPHREEQSLRSLLSRPVSGIILCASRLPAKSLVDLRGSRSTPMVVINRQVDDPAVSCIMVDSRQATYRAARHLLNLSHTRIAFFAGPIGSESSLARRQGVQAALAEVGLQLRPEWCPITFPSVDGGFQAMSALLSLPPLERPTAVIAYNDIMALGALHAVRAHQLHVPDDISVIGFDDIAMAAHTNPPLTTIAQPKYRMGRLAMRMLRQQIAGQASASEGYTLVESSLVVRESTGPAPAVNGNGKRT